MIRKFIKEGYAKAIKKCGMPPFVENYPKYFAYIKCVSSVKIKVENEAIDKAKALLLNCKKSKHPEKCEKALKDEIKNRQEKIQILKIDVEKALKNLPRYKKKNT